MSKNTENIKTEVTNVTSSTKKDNFLKALKNNLGNISQACKAINISRQTFYAWSEDADFKIKAENVKESLLDLAESKLMENINNNENIAIIFYLKTKGKQRGYIEKQEVEVVKPISEVLFDEL